MRMSDAEIAKLRNTIYAVMCKCKDDVSAEMIEMLVVNKLSREDKGLLNKVHLTHIGNNLRVMKDKGIVKDNIDGVVKKWRVISKDDYIANPPVKMVISLPQEQHTFVTKQARKLGVSKTAYILDCIHSVYIKARK